MMCLSDLAVISQKEMLCVRSLMTLSWDKAVSHCLTNQISLANQSKCLFLDQMNHLKPQMRHWLFSLALSRRKIYQFHLMIKERWRDREIVCHGKNRWKTERERERCKWQVHVAQPKAGDGESALVLTAASFLQAGKAYLDCFSHGLTF